MASSEPQPTPDDQPVDPEPAHVDHDVAAEPAEVWESLTSDEGLAEWMGEGATIEPVVDGRIAVPDPVTGRPRTGHIERVVPAERLDFTWWPVDDPAETSRVSIVLQPLEHGTRIRVAEQLCHLVGRADASTRPAPLLADWTWRCAVLSLAHRLITA